MIEIPDDVNEFMKRCAGIVGEHAKCGFYIDIHGDAGERESPIEMLFEAALRTIIHTNSLEADASGNGWITWYPQQQLGRYRVDYECVNLRTQSKVVVELDGHEFHDKNKEQRQYEKRRDREIQKLGYKVFRYTGSEIVGNPFEAAAEVLSFLTGAPEEILLDEMNLNPCE